MVNRQHVEQGLHDRAVKDIARVRFAGGNWVNKVVYTNPNGEHNLGVNTGHTTLYPDLVIVQRSTRVLTEVVEVETASSVSEYEAPQWRDYSKFGVPLYLYVPLGWGEAAKRISRNLKIGVSYFREWSYDNGRLIVREI